MSANIDTLLYVGETPWHGLGTRYASAPTTAEEVIRGAHLDWTVAADPMFTAHHDKVQNYHAIYREDADFVLGVVNKQYPVLVQNVDAFSAFDNLIGSDVSVETAASLGFGERVFGCFKINEKYKVQDDEIEHYLVVFNDHLKADGKITVLNTPVRVVCQNTLSAALSDNLLKYRIKCSHDDAINSSLASHILEASKKSKKALIERSEELLSRKVTRETVEKILDELFPYIKVEGESTHTRANERTAMMRETFLTKCMGADNLANYRGTHYQVFNALTDFTQHYFKNSDNGLDLESRMKLLPGSGSESASSKVSKFLSMSGKLIA